jgi:prolyl-tRNA synthetase
MKDAYSFHTSQEDLERYYDICYKAYERIFARAGIPEVITVASDSGMMGGKISHEYMLLTPIGEDSIAVCQECDYRANMEAAESIIKNEMTGESKELELVHTPDIHTIEDICNFLKTPLEESCKAVVYQKNMTDEYVVIFIRGDLDINETKLTNYLGEAVHPAIITDDCGLFAGFTGPVGITDNCTVLFDTSLQNTNNLICGGNKEEYHYSGLDIERDCGNIEYHDFAKILEGGICPNCKKHSISISRGIEVGNIFQLGTKYSAPMNACYTDENGKLNPYIMGCYGIGVSRTMAAAIEKYHDDFGIIWPLEIAPYQVDVVPVSIGDETQMKVRSTVTELFTILNKQGGFLRVGSSYIINLRHVKNVSRTDVLLYNNKKIQIPRGKHVEIKNAFWDYQYETQEE